MAALISSGMFDVVLGSRVLGGYALKGACHFINISLTGFDCPRKYADGQKLSEYHTGYRAFSKDVLQTFLFREFERFCF